MVVHGKDEKAVDLSYRIDAPQRDLALFRKLHGPEPELNAQVLAWLKAVCAEK
jgi:hypothetical protein